MIKIYIFTAGMFLALLTGCEKQDAGAKKEVTNQKLVETKSTEMKVEGLPDAKNPIEQIKESVSGISQSRDPFQYVRNELAKFEHETLNEQATETDWSSIEIDLFKDIRDPNSLWNRDQSLKTAVLGKISLLTGLIGEGDAISFNQIPTLFENNTLSRDKPTKGEILFLRTVIQAEKLRTISLPINARSLDKWNQLAQSRNPVCREIALLLSKKIAFTETQRRLFMQNYINESDPRILLQLPR
jgi:hypothetical protein